MCLHKNLKHDRSRQLTNLNLQCDSHTYSVNLGRQVPKDLLEDSFRCRTISRVMHVHPF